MSTQFKRLYPMEFDLVKLQACNVQTATLLYMDFTTYTFWSMFQKLTVFERIFSARKSMVYQRLNKVAILLKRGLTSDLVEEELKILMHLLENLLGTNFFW